MAHEPLQLVDVHARPQIPDGKGSAKGVGRQVGNLAAIPQDLCHGLDACPCHWPAVVLGVPERFPSAGNAAQFHEVFHQLLVGFVAKVDNAVLSSFT